MAATSELEDDRDAESADIDDAARPEDSRPKSRRKIEFEPVLQRSEAASYFGALVEGLRQGKLQFRHGEENLSLAPAQQLLVEVKASRKGDKEKVAFELEWRRGGEDAARLNG